MDHLCPLVIPWLGHWLTAVIRRSLVLAHQAHPVVLSVESPAPTGDPILIGFPNDWLSARPACRLCPPRPLFERRHSPFNNQVCILTKMSGRAQKRSSKKSQERAALASFVESSGVDTMPSSWCFKRNLACRMASGSSRCAKCVRRGRSCDGSSVAPACSCFPLLWSSFPWHR